MQRADNQIIIGLIGKAGSGKSTVAKYLSMAHGFARRPMAYRLKAMINALGVNDNILYGNVEDKEIPLPELNGQTARYAMQTLGTEWGRDIMGKSFWLDLWMRDVAFLPRIVCDDVRFENEADAIRKIGGYLIKIERSGSGLEGTGSKHASEMIDGLKPDEILQNDSSIDILYAKLDAIVLDLSESK